MNMNRILIIIFISILTWFFSETILAQSTELNLYTDFDLALEAAQDENKEVFVYVSRGHTPKGKKLDSLFQEREVVDFLNKKYISVKLDDLPNVKYIKSYTRQQYPVLLFFDSAGEELHKIPYCCRDYSKDIFFNEALFASTRPLPRKEQLEKTYNQRKSDPEFLKELLVLANRYGNKKLEDKVLDQYAQVYHLDTENEWMNLVLKYVSKESSLLFKILLNHREEFENKFGTLEVQSEILRILLEKVKLKFDQVKTDGLIEQLVKKVNKYELDIDVEQLMLAVAKRKYSDKCNCYKIKNDKGEFAFQMLKSHSQVIDYNMTTSLVWDIVNHSDNRFFLETALDHLEELLAGAKSYSLLDCKSELLYKLGLEEEAENLAAIVEENAPHLKEKFKKNCGYTLRIKQF